MMSQEINYKEIYKKQIEDIGKFLIRNSEKIIEDIDYERIKSITFVSNIENGSIPTIRVDKEYYPLEVQNDNN